MTDNEKINIEVVEMTNFKEGTCTACVEEEGRCPACKVQDIGETYDPDSSDKAWEYYKHVYKDEKEKCDKRLEFLNKLNGDGKIDTKYQLKKKSNRLIAETIDKTIPIPDFAGDTMFNFKHGKYSSFIKVSGIDTNQLVRCAKNHHSLLNFSLMPKTGAMNNVKGCWPDDPCNFFVKLNKYLCIPKPIRSESISIIFKDTFEIFNHATYLNLPVIKNFLDEFVSLDDYCKTFYNIDKTYKYLELSKENVIDKWLKQYMDLAEDYWEMRHKQLQNDLLKSNLCQSCKQGDCNCHHYYYTDRDGTSKSYCYHDNCKPETSI